jgi:hypothetical protein
MFFSSGFSVFLFAAALLQKSMLVYAANLPFYNYVRVEIDPVYTTIKANCSTAFQNNLRSQMQGWVNDGVALYFGQRDDQHIPYNLTYVSGWNGQWNHRNLDEQIPQEYRQQLRSRVEAKVEDRKLCSKTTCYDCCVLACYIYCGCFLCGGGRELQYFTPAISAVSANVDQAVTLAVQVLASLWLSQNDATGCMGNPWGVDVSVNFF